MNLMNRDMTALGLKSEEPHHVLNQLHLDFEVLIQENEVNKLTSIRYTYMQYIRETVQLNSSRRAACKNST